MAQVIGQIDSLTSLLSIFKDNGIILFKSLNDIIDFNNNFTDIINLKRDEVIKSLNLEIDNLKTSIPILIDDFNSKLAERETLLLNEKENIIFQIEQYSKSSNNFFKILYYKYKLFVLIKRKDVLDNYFEKEKRKPYSNLEKKISDYNKQLSYLVDNFNKVVQERFQSIENKYNKAKSLLRENNSIFLGAIGEQKAVNVLKTLPDSYYVINNFNLSINPPIYNKNNGDYI